MKINKETDNLRLAKRETAQAVHRSALFLFSLFFLMGCSSSGPLPSPADVTPTLDWDKAVIQAEMGGAAQCAPSHLDDAHVKLSELRRIAQGGYERSVIHWAEKSAGASVRNLSAQLEICRDPARPRRATLQNADSDGDGASDWDEKTNYNTDPDKKDTDGGGVSDAQEKRLARTNPLIGADDNPKLRTWAMGAPIDRELVDFTGSKLRYLKAIAEKLWEFPGTKLIIEGHTDNRRNLAVSIEHSHRNAVAVAEVLTARYAIAPDRIIAEGYGPHRPIESNTTEAGRKENSRIVITLVAE